MDSYQFYPTPLVLARRAWALFQRREVSRLLEPSAGKGDLLAPHCPANGMRGYEAPRFRWDAIELNLEHHARLRELGAKIVGHDFLTHTSCAMYSHIIMNPPFAQGAAHVLHAWRTLFDGEIVAILNAETLRNPHTVERKHLLALVGQHGSVEYIPDAFAGEDAERKTPVEIALVYLRKVGDSGRVIGDILGDLRKEAQERAPEVFQPPNELMLPSSFVEATVLNFEAAVRAAREAAIARVRANHYASRLGQTLEMLQQAERAPEQPEKAAERARDLFATEYDDLKNAAWASIIRSTQVTSRLSSAAQKRAEAEFENIRMLEFSLANVQGFLAGLAASAGAIQLDMVCDVFDSVARHHSDNTVFYRGWKSNDRHRVGLRIRHTRFIIPGHIADDWRTRGDWQTLRFLSDFDKVFAMLDGKVAPAVSLESLFENPTTYQQLVGGARLSSDYFDVRYYRKRGTIHFFPRNMEVVDRLNRTVGRHRQWLPPEASGAPADFYTQYEKADKFHDEVIETLRGDPKLRSHGVDRCLWLLSAPSGRDPEEVAQAEQCLDEALRAVQTQHGLEPFAELAHRHTPLLAA